MDKNEFLDLLCGSDLPSEDKVNELKEIIKQHPYSPLPHFILAKFYYHIDHPDKEKYLQMASAYAIDRKVLKRFIQQEYVASHTQDEENILFDRHLSNNIEENTMEVVSAEEIYSSESEAKEETNNNYINAQTSIDSDSLALTNSIEDNIDENEATEYKIEKSEPQEEIYHSPAETASEALVQEVNDNLEELRNLKNQRLASEEANKEQVSQASNEDNILNGEIKETDDIYSSEEVSESYVESELFNEGPDSIEELPSEEISDEDNEAISAPPLENGHDKIQLSDEQIPEKEAIDEYEDKGESSLLLDYLTKINSNKEEELENNYRSHQHDLIEKFIKYTPSLSRASINDRNLENQEDLSERSITSDNDLVSENLAVIMTKQGKIEKAIDIYKKLIWKYPQKKVYFASRIEELKK